MNKNFLYKYISEKWAHEFMTCGTILFRSLTYYIDLEKKYGNQVRGDENEGKVPVKYPTDCTIDTFLEFGAHKIPIQMTRLDRVVRNADDIFISCFSSGEDLYEKFKTNCRIVINDTTEFFRRLEKSIPYPNAGHMMVNYIDGILHSEVEGPDPVFCKSLKFKEEQEYRVAFEVVSGERDGIEGIHLKGMGTDSDNQIFTKIIAIKVSLGNLEDIVKVDYR